MPATFVVGKDCKAYYNSGTFGSPTWVEVSNLSKGKMGLTGNTADARRRASGLFHQYALTGLDLGFSYNALWNLGDTVFAALLAAAIAGTEIDMIFLDGATTSGAHQGPRMSAIFAKFDREEDENGIVTANVEIKPGLTYVPSWFTGTV